MSGIAGFIHLGAGRIDSYRLATMTGAMAHRGPDDEGFVAMDTPSGRCLPLSGTGTIPSVRRRLVPLSSPGPMARVGLAHRDNALSEPSEAAHQPFLSTDRMVSVVSDGEIHNAADLRRDLERKGQAFRTRSSAEVILVAYRVWGPDCFARFNGSWAIALFDAAQNTLILSRDRVGQKPLFWTRMGEVIYFASEIKGLLALPDVGAKRGLNREAAARWLGLGVRDCGRATFLEGIERVPAGTAGPVNKSFPYSLERYWSLPRRRLRARDISVSDAADRLRNLLSDAVKLRLPCDGAMAVELSGGLDTASLVALSTRASGSGVTTYTVKHNAEDHQSGQCGEEFLARQVAERWRTDYRVLVPGPLGFWRHAGAFSQLQDEPYHGPGLFSRQVLWSQMRGQGTRALMTATGADEIFAGQMRHIQYALVSMMRGGRMGDLAGTVMGTSSLSDPGRGMRHTFQGLLRAAAVAAGRPDPFAGRSSLGRRSGGGASAAGNGVEAFQSVLADLRPRRINPFRAAGLERALIQDMNVTSMPGWLAAMDQGAMGVPLALRMPMLDPKVLDFVFTLPVAYLIRGGWTGWILRKAMEPLLPEATVWRRRSSVPGTSRGISRDGFMRQSRPYIDLLIEQGDVPWLDKRKAESVYGDWKAVSFLLWYERVINGNDALFQRIEALADRQYEAEGRKDATGPFGAFRPAYLEERVETAQAA